MSLNDYGTKEELIRVVSTIRKTMFDFWMGKIDKKKFLRVYWEFEGFLLEHGYIEEDKYFKCDLPDTEKFLQEQYTLEDIRRAIDFDKFNYEYGNAVGLKSEEAVEKFIKSLKK